MTTFSMLAAGVTILGLAIGVGKADAGEPACTVQALQAQAPGGTTITEAARVHADGTSPEQCRVDGHVAVPGNQVRFRLALPDIWNGKYLFVGVGGLGGTIGNLSSGLARGYATASTDTGHSADDPSWGGNRAKEIDYGHRGTHVTAVAAKALTASFFGKPPAHAYFNGCSNGGRQALMEVQRYPDDFDGIIAGDPATGTPMQVGRALVFQHMLLTPANYLPPAKVEVLSKASLAACDASDGLADGLITDPRRCTFAPATLVCKGEDGPDCLTAAQVATAEKIYSRLRMPDGSVYTTGLPVGHEGGASGWQAWTIGRAPATMQSDGTLAFGSPLPNGYNLSESNMRFLATEDDDPSFSWKTIRFPQDLPRLATMAEILSPLDADLRPFKTRGGKLLMYHGWADPAISAYGTIEYYERMRATADGQTEADAFSRLYLVPGMHHCSGGPGPDSFDMLTVLERWVEQGEAPGRVIASKLVDGKAVRSRPLCPHPQVARYRGTGSVDDAESFVCDVR